VRKRKLLIFKFIKMTTKILKLTFGVLLLTLMAFKVNAQNPKFSQVQKLVMSYINCYI